MRLSRMSFVFLCAAVFAGPAISEVKTFGNAVNMAKVPGVELTSGQRKALKNYSRKKAYFGAFFVVPGTDNFFWTRNFHNLDTAKAAAKKGCEIISEGKSLQAICAALPQRHRSKRNPIGRAQPTHSQGIQYPVSQTPEERKIRRFRDQRGKRLWRVFWLAQRCRSKRSRQSLLQRSKRKGFGITWHRGAQMGAIQGIGQMPCHRHPFPRLISL